LDALLTTVILVTSYVLFFLFGMFVANHYNDKAAAETKDALERQFIRLQARADADDPCRPYKANARCRLVLPEQFENTLKTTGQATAFLNKRSKQPDAPKA